LDPLVQNIESPALAAVWLTTITFLIYRYRGAHLTRRFLGNADIRRQRVIGAILLGLLPGIILVLGFDLNLADHGLATPQFVSKGAWSVGILLIAVPLIHRQAQKETYWEHYPELRNEFWSKKTTFSNALSWMIYLLAYEFLFRGLLLMSLNAWLGQEAAISIMAAMYVLSHVDKSQEETFGSLAMSVVFALAALGTNSIWLPWFMHCTIAIASDTFSMRANPKMKCEP
jgi:membrane protease YdiL (CAAX protease family)